MTEVINTRVSLVLDLIDRFTGERAFGKIHVSVPDNNPRIVKNLTGYYVFLNMERQTCQIRIKSRYYFTQFVEVELSLLDPDQPIVTVELDPCPGYPFPPGVTLIRGHVVWPGGSWAPASDVNIIEKPEVKGKTDKKGEFVLYFKNLTRADIVRRKDRHFVKGVEPDITQLRVLARNGLNSGQAIIPQLREGTVYVIEPPIPLEREPAAAEPGDFE